MTKRKPDPLKVDDLEGFHLEFSEIVENKDDRSNVILGTALVEGYLQRLIATLLVDDTKRVDELFNFNGPFGTFGNKIKVAYSLGLISKVEYINLEIIREIRNEFAHSLHGISFTDNWVESKLQSLEVVSKIIPASPITPQIWFQVVIYSLVIQIKFRITQAEDARRVIPDELPWWEEKIEDGLAFAPFDVDVLVKLGYGTRPKISDFPSGLSLVWRNKQGDVETSRESLQSIPPLGDDIKTCS